jgi:DNA-binding response OmpR family regulator
MKKKILIIDDDQDILDITKILLNQIGYEVITSLTADILSELSQINPDIILLDDWLDGTKGHKECKILKSADATKNIPIIIFSAANGIEKIAEECLADGFIKKPFDIDYLYQVIEDHLYSSYQKPLI